MNRRVGIVGAGVSGLAAAWALKDCNCEVVVFEKARGVSGRAASRSRGAVRYDHGANYFKTDSPEVAHLVLEVLPTEELVDIGRDVWTFDELSTVSPGDPEQNAKPKWTYKTGISTLGKRLAEVSEAELRCQTRIESIEQIEGQWSVSAAARDDSLGLFDALIITPPGPQAGTILQHSTFDTKLKAPLIESLSESEYNLQYSCVLAFDETIRRPGDFYALVNTDGKHPIAWLSFEEDKPDHVPSGMSVLVVQMAPSWSAQRKDGDSVAIVSSVIAEAAQLLGLGLLKPSWTDLQRWKFAHPATVVDAEALRGGEHAGLFFAGDALVGHGRIPRAIETGLQCAKRISKAFDTPWS